MWQWYNTLLVLADDTLQRAPVAPGDGQPPQNPWGGILTIMLPAIAVMLIIQMVMRRSEAGDKKRRVDQLASLKKNDPVVTIGGIKGTFVSASEDKAEITIKVDDNTRLKVEASAIREFGPKKTEEQAKS